MFSPPSNGTQTGTAYYATGRQARQPEPAGDGLKPHDDLLAEFPFPGLPNP